MELAVLSACDTGLGELDQGGEGVFGLQRAFHLGGCRNVVASLWKVDDEPTAALMALFYHNLWQKGEKPLDALRHAQLALLRHPEEVPLLAYADRLFRRRPARVGYVCVSSNGRPALTGTFRGGLRVWEPLLTLARWPEYAAASDKFRRAVEWAQTNLQRTNSPGG